MVEQPNKTPEERFKPETPREERLFEHAKGNWYTEEWSKVSRELEQNEDLVSEYKKFLGDAIKKEATEKMEISVMEKAHGKQEKVEKQETTNEWSLENLNKIAESDEGKLEKLFFAFVALENMVVDGLIANRKMEEAMALDRNMKELAKKFKGKKVEGLLIEFRNLFKKYDLPDSILNIEFLSNMLRDFEEGP